MRSFVAACGNETWLKLHGDRLCACIEQLLLRGCRRLLPRPGRAAGPAGSRVAVCNTVGPFASMAGRWSRPAWPPDCHDLDTTGEQDWLVTCDENYGQPIAARACCWRPGVAQMYTTGEIAAELCLESPGVDTLDILASGRACRPSPRP